MGRGVALAKPKAGLLHSLARSGATIVVRHLGAMDGVALYSEIHPQGAVAACSLGGADTRHLYNIMLQAKHWQGLYPDSDEDALMTLSDTGNSREIMLDVVKKTLAAGKRPVFRDWSFLDFHGYPAMAPTYRYSVYEQLCDDCELSRVGLIRHPLSQFLSMLHSYPMGLSYQRIEGMTLFLEGDARFVAGIPADRLIKFEDFLADPVATVQRLSRMLDIPFDPAFAEKAASNNRITGDTDARIHGQPRPIHG